MAQVPLVFARRFSASATSGQLVKTPIQLFGLNGRYATALYSAATKEKQLEAVEQDLKEIQGIVKKKGKVYDYFSNPSLNRSDKKELLTSALAKTKASKLTANLMGLLAENGRLNDFDAIATSFARIMAAHRGEVDCEVVTAKPLDAALQQELNATLKSFVKAGETIKLTTRVDPSLLGGMVVSIADRYVDMSTATKLKKYSDIIKAAI